MRTPTLIVACLFSLVFSISGCRQQAADVPDAGARSNAAKTATKSKTKQAEPKTFEREEPFVLREFSPLGENFEGRGISYGPYRNGQRPGGREPTRDQLKEDLQILANNGWQMIRTYGTEPFARTVCEIIRDEKMAMKVMLGAWVATEKGNAAARRNNQGQVRRAIQIANAFPKVVVAVNVANESQVFWSFHKVEPETLINYVREVRSQIKQPVTVADDFKYWTTDESKRVAEEIDFIVTHIYAMWLGKQLDESMAFTKETYKNVCEQHPNRQIVIGEGGWATQKSSTGEQAERIKGVAGEQEQKQFYESYTSWLLENNIAFFYFEAFDEPWKGGNDPADAEKHWGLYREDRTPKPAVAE